MHNKKEDIMTRAELRDHFAALAMQSLIGMVDKTLSGNSDDEMVIECVNHGGWGSDHPITINDETRSIASVLANDAYYIAEMMLDERDRLEREHPIDLH